MGTFLRTRRISNILFAGAIVTTIAALSLEGVESFVLPSQQPSSAPPATTVAGSSLNRHVSHHDSRKRTRSSGVFLKSSENKNDNDTLGWLEPVGLACQPVVWVSLYSVATTGGGLPAGPGGSIGAIEGLAYLIVVVLALLPPVGSPGAENEPSFFNAKYLSRRTIFLGILVLAALAGNKGCVPNAKPILDYSAYLPVCSSE
mmetsp:Transcript_8587/g.17931  ORF Transcript_8587/g.17931 Transcript_8587/m.17931 type:complete len:202 (+) Transcript_8587:95-700(+)|eukprot:CAMPEP_0201167650 /NCGR_PEP_ID=MMETSP0851-20130426/73509_1 /ASSEMBLY_ACC=CAM_ASM_000631 /TAXON_ID=183588 /ORGANISM="Pseudo-nitzschia fraudulenta, Strain WWA7" /LENGTH=201 /DNA_ID=CAMNT_0047448959 /DNA_START=168 /DNA_END=773 /DNA_ORIENTATION=-